MLSRNAKYIFAVLGGLGVMATVPMFMLGQKKQTDSAARAQLDKQLRSLQSLQERQQHLLDKLVEREGAHLEQAHNDQLAARHGEAQMHSEHSEQQPTQTKLEPDPNCKDNYEGCPAWEDCCPGEIAHQGTKCSAQDCAEQGKPCEGGFMKSSCQATCGICIPIEDSSGEAKSIETIWEREGQDHGTLQKYPEVSWKKWHESRPRVVSAKNVLNKEQMREILKRAAPKMKRSKVVHPTNSSEGVDDVRTSSGMWMNENVAPARHIRNVVSELVGVPTTHFESLQILHYSPGEKYIHHSDFFEANMKDYLGNSGNRIATAIVFLNDVPEGKGGDTRFVYAKPEPVGFTPEAGTLALFYNIMRNGKVDRKSEHEAVPPHEGFEKWVAITWVRERPVA